MLVIGCMCRVTELTSEEIDLQPLFYGNTLFFIYSIVNTWFFVICPPNSFSQFVPKNHASFHHEFHFLQFCNVFERVAAYCHKVRPLPGFDGSGRFAPESWVSQTSLLSTCRCV